MITLLEESKRARRQGDIALGHQPLKVTLPYTRMPFIVPPNLYIIGTMNTADRSLIGLDVALRRRFNFVELPPRPEALPLNAGGVNLRKFLATLNNRVETRLDADHLIGHAFFAGLTTINQVRDAMVQKVIPLLREYFYDRPEALRYVLSIDGDINFAKFKAHGRNIKFDGVENSNLNKSDNYETYSDYIEK